MNIVKRSINIIFEEKFVYLYLKFIFSKKIIINNIGQCFYHYELDLPDPDPETDPEPETLERPEDVEPDPLDDELVDPEVEVELFLTDPVPLPWLEPQTVELPLGLPSTSVPLPEVSQSSQLTVQVDG